MAHLGLWWLALGFLAFVVAILLFDALATWLSRLGGQEGNWDALWRGASLLVEAAWRSAWAGAQWACARVRTALRRPPVTHQTVTLLKEAEAVDEPVVAAQHLIGMQNEIGTLVQRGEARSKDETYRLEYLRRELKAHGARAVADAGGSAPVPLLSAVSDLVSPVTRYAMLAAVAGWGLLGVDQIRIGRIKDETALTKTRLKDVSLKYAVVTGRLEIAEQRISAANAQTTLTAHTLEEERARNAAAAVRERKRKRAIQDVLDGVGDPPDWLRGSAESGTAPAGTHDRPG